MSDDNDQDRPENRDKAMGFRVPKEVYDQAQAKAKREGRSLGAILRAWLFFWVNDEAPTPPVIEDESRRARKRSKKKK